MRILLLFLGLVILAIHARRVKKSAVPSHFPGGTPILPSYPMTEEELEMLKNLIELPVNHARTRSKYGRKSAVPFDSSDGTARSSHRRDLTIEEIEEMVKGRRPPPTVRMTIFDDVRFPRLSRKSKYFRKSKFETKCPPGVLATFYPGCKYSGGFKEEADEIDLLRTYEDLKSRNTKYSRKSFAPFECPPGMPTNYIPGCIQSDHWEKMEESGRGNSDDEDRKDYWPHRPWEYEGFPFWKENHGQL